MAASRARDTAGARTPARARLNTETSTEPEGITRRVMLNVLEAFFRRPWLHLLPLILMLALGVATVASMKPQFLSIGTLRATNESLLNDITAANSNQGFAFESPATRTANQINELLRTDEFIDRVAEASGGTTTVAPEALRGEVRSALGAFADGDNLVRVSAKTAVPATSERLVTATMEAYRAAAIESQTEQSPATEEFLNQRVQDAQIALDEANAALDAFIDQNPQLTTEAARIRDQTALRRLQSAADRAQTQYNNAVDALDAAELTAAQAETVVNQRIRVVDPPGPGIKESVVRKQGMTLILFGVLGLMLSLALVIVTATLDRTIRIPNDITARFGLDVLAVVPDTKR